MAATASSSSTSSDDQMDIRRDGRATLERKLRACEAELARKREQLHYLKELKRLSGTQLVFPQPPKEAMERSDFDMEARNFVAPDQLMKQKKTYEFPLKMGHLTEVKKDSTGQILSVQIAPWLDDAHILAIVRETDVSFWTSSPDSWKRAAVVDWERPIECDIYGFVPVTLFAGLDRRVAVVIAESQSQGGLVTVVAADLCDGFTRLCSQFWFVDTGVSTSLICRTGRHEALICSNALRLGSPTRLHSYVYQPDELEVEDVFVHRTRYTPVWHTILSLHKLHVNSNVVGMSSKSAFIWDCTSGYLFRTVPLKPCSLGSFPAGKCQWMVTKKNFLFAFMNVSDYKLHCYVIDPSTGRWSLIKEFCSDNVITSATCFFGYVLGFLNTSELVCWDMKSGDIVSRTEINLHDQIVYRLIGKQLIISGVDKTGDVHVLDMSLDPLTSV